MSLPETGRSRLERGFERSPCLLEAHDEIGDHLDIVGRFLQAVLVQGWGLG